MTGTKEALKTAKMMYVRQPMFVMAIGKILTWKMGYRISLSPYEIYLNKRTYHCEIDNPVAEGR